MGESRACCRQLNLDPNLFYTLTVQDHADGGQEGLSYIHYCMTRKDSADHGNSGSPLLSNSDDIKAMEVLEKIHERHMKSKESLIGTLRQEDRFAADEYRGKMVAKMRSAQAQREMGHVSFFEEHDLLVTSKDPADDLFMHTSNEDGASWQPYSVASSETSASSNARSSRDDRVSFDKGHRFERPCRNNASENLKAQLSKSHGVPAENGELRKCSVEVGYVKESHLEKGACPVRPPPLQEASTISMEDHAAQRTVTSEDIPAMGLELEELQHAAEEDCETGSGKGFAKIVERFKSLHPDENGVDADDGSDSPNSRLLNLRNYERCIKDNQVKSEPGQSVDHRLAERTHECSDAMDVDYIPTVHRPAHYATPGHHEGAFTRFSTATQDWYMEKNEGTHPKFTDPIKRVRHMRNQDFVSDKIAKYDFTPNEYVELPKLDFQESFFEKIWDASLLDLPADMARPPRRPSKRRENLLPWYNLDRHYAPQSTREAKSSLQEARSSSVVNRWKGVDLASQMKVLSRPSSLTIVIKGVADLPIATEACENGKAGVVAIEHERIEENMQHRFSAEDFKRAHPCLVIVYKTCELKNGTIRLQSDRVAQCNDVIGPDNLLETTLDRILSYVQAEKWESLRTIVVARNSTLLSVGQGLDLPNLTLVKGVDPTYSHLPDLVRSRLLLVRMIFHSLRPSSRKSSPVEINFLGHNPPGNRLTPDELLDYDANSYEYRPHANYAAFRFLTSMYPFSTERIISNVRNPLYLNQRPKHDLKLAQSYALAVMLETFRPNCLEAIELVRQEDTIRPFRQASPTLIIILPEPPYWASEAASTFVEKSDSTLKDFNRSPSHDRQMSTSDYIWKEVMSEWQNFYQGLEPKVAPTVIIAAKSEKFGLGYAFRLQKSRVNVKEVLKMFQGHPWVNIVILSEHSHDIVQQYETGITNGRIRPSEDRRIMPKRVTLVSTTLETTNRPLRDLLSKGMNFTEQCLALAVSNDSATMVIAVSAREYYCLQSLRKDPSGTFWTFDVSSKTNSILKEFFSQKLGISSIQRSEIELALKIFHLLVPQV